MSGTPGADIEAYAALTAALVEGDRAREEVLRDHGLDEAGWTAIDAVWQERLSRAMDDDGDAVPPLVAAYAAAFERARAALRRGSRVLSIEQYADATREIQRRGDPTGVLSQLGFTLTDFLRASEYWTRRMIDEPEILQRYRVRLGLV
jgi:hypothetical protein